MDIAIIIITAVTLVLVIWIYAMAASVYLKAMRTLRSMRSDINWIYRNTVDIKQLLRSFKYKYDEDTAAPIDDDIKLCTFDDKEIIGIPKNVASTLKRRRPRRKSNENKQGS